MGENSATDDDVLWQRYQKGDIAAFDSLVLRHGAALLSYIRGMTGSTTEAEDLFQETWHKVIRHAGTFTAGAWRGWVWRIARNAVIDRLRRRRPDASLDDPVGDEGAVLGDFVADDGLAIPDRIAGAEVEGGIAACVAELPELQREVFLLRTVSGLSFKEIAKTLGIPLNTALGRMHYAVTRLRVTLTQKGVWS